MPFERTKFGNGLAAGAGGSNVVRDVNHHFGPREFNNVVGKLDMDGAINEIAIDLKPAVLTANGFPLLPPILPALSKILAAYVEVEEVFNITGTTPTVRIGTKSSEATNGITITEAQLEALGMYDVSSTLAGTWTAAGGLTAATTVGIIRNGDTAAVGTGGKARVLIRYIKL